MRRKVNHVIDQEHDIYYRTGSHLARLHYEWNILVQSQIGIESIGLCIILFTIVIYMLLMPLTIKQQKFSKLQSKMNPEAAGNSEEI